MNQDYKELFGDNDPTEKQVEEDNENYYPSHGNMRSLSFVWLDGKVDTFNYSDILRRTLDPTNNDITLDLMRYNIIIKGVKLHLLFFDLVAQLPKFIIIRDKRYNVIKKKEEKYIVNEVAITEK